MKCVVCKKRTVVSIAIGKCEVCLYEEEKGLQALERQLKLPAVRREKRK